MRIFSLLLILFACSFLSVYGLEDRAKKKPTLMEQYNQKFQKRFETKVFVSPRAKTAVRKNDLTIKVYGMPLEKAENLAHLGVDA